MMFLLYKCAFSRCCKSNVKNIRFDIILKKSSTISFLFSVEMCLVCLLYRWRRRWFKVIKNLNSEFYEPLKM